MSVALEAKRLLGSTKELDRVTGIGFEKLERMIEALDRLRRYADARLTALENAPAAPAALPAVIHQAVSLGAGVNNIAAATPPREGALLYVVMTSAAATPGAITWSSDFVNGPAVPPGNAKVHVALFCGTATKWRLLAVIVGQP